MARRRQFFAVLASACGLAPVALWLTRSVGASALDGRVFPVRKSEQEWRDTLTTGQYRILRRGGTERPFSSPLNAEKREGLFICAGCERGLFSSETKFESGTGWPSFWQPLPEAVETVIDLSWLMVRTEVRCGGCGGHLGHVFNDGPEPTGRRYCMNGAALNFQPKG
jgi:peptide-methionine (R)-S-oxide reductase